MQCNWKHKKIKKKNMVKSSITMQRKRNPVTRREVDMSQLERRKAERDERSRLLRTWVILRHKHRVVYSHPRKINQVPTRKLSGMKNGTGKELHSHKKVERWTEQQLAKDKKAIETKWLFRIKGNGTKKARVGGRGFQVSEENYS